MKKHFEKGFSKELLLQYVVLAGVGIVGYRVTQTPKTQSCISKLQPWICGVRTNNFIEKHSNYQEP